MLEIHQGDFDKNNPPAVGKAYMEDNLGLDRLSGGALIPHDAHITILSEPEVKPETFQAVDAYENIEWVLKHAGARPSERSREDVRIVQTLIDGTGSIIDSQDEVGGYPEIDSTSRSIDGIPSSAENRRIWLDSISSSLEVVESLDLSTLYQFIDENLPTAMENAFAFFWKCYYIPGSDQVQVDFQTEKKEHLHIQLLDIMGRRILTKELRYDPGTHKAQILLGEYALPDGFYLLTVSDGVRIQSRAIVLY